MTPKKRHHLDQTEAWAIETVNQLARIQAKLYDEMRGHGDPPPSSRLATCEEVAAIIGTLDLASARSLLYVFISHAGETVLAEADALYEYEQRFGGPDGHRP